MLSEKYQLFHYEACQFCQRVRRYARRAGIDLTLRDIRQEPHARRELVEGGGRPTVPCLRIEGEDGVRWLYESAAIIDYLNANASEASDGGG